MTGTAAVAALQEALAAENAAIYGCGVAGAHLTGGQLGLITQAWNAHRARRDQLGAMLRSRGATPRAALPSYQLPRPVNGPRDAVSLALLVEDRVTAAYLALVALPDAALRGYGALAMQEAAVRAESWRGGTTAFPGLPGSAIGSPRARKSVTADGAAAAWAATAAATSPGRSRGRQAGSQSGPRAAGHAGFVPASQQGPDGNQGPGGGQGSGGKHRGKGPSGKLG